MLQYVNLACWRTAHSSYKSTKFCLPVCHPSAYITKAFLVLINKISNKPHNNKSNNLYFLSLFRTKYLPCVSLIPASLFCCFLSRLEIVRQTKWQKLHAGTWLLIRRKCCKTINDDSCLSFRLTVCLTVRRTLFFCLIVCLPVCYTVCCLIIVVTFWLTVCLTACLTV
jgi:hypothetical protein